MTKKKTNRAYGPPELTIGFTERDEPNWQRKWTTEMMATPSDRTSKLNCWVGKGKEGTCVSDPTR